MKLQDLTGIEFRLKDLRSTFASQTIQEDSSRFPEVSQQLGNSFIVTMQKFNADMNLIDAGTKLKKAWLSRESEQNISHGKNSELTTITENEKVSRNSIKPLIGSKEYLAGYR